MKIFITAIGTDSGKTVVSSIFTEALNADYWKPVQAGFPRDTDVVCQLVSNQSSTFYAEAYLLKSPESPHSASKKENIIIKLEKIIPPETSRNLIIEGAGGIMVPLNDTDYVIDIAQTLKVPVVLVSNIYLGSINHTLLSVEELRRRKLEVLGIVFNGEENPAAEEIILQKSGYKRLLRIRKESEINKETIKRYALELKENLRL